MALVLLETMGLLQHVGKKETEELLRKCSGDVDQDSKVVEDLLSALKGMTIEVGNIHAYLTLLAASVDYLPTKTFSGDAILLEATEKAMLIPNDDYNLSTVSILPMLNTQGYGCHMCAALRNELIFHL